MMRQGDMTPAPHSLRHHRVAASPEFRQLAVPGRTRGYFSMPEYGMIWGMPNFPLGHALTTRAFRPAPDLLRLVRSVVPQEREEARRYLAARNNRQALLRRITELDSLGSMETVDEHRGRIFREFLACRKRFVRLFGSAPVSFCWPWGDYNAVALEEARRAGFRLFFTTAVGANTRSSFLRVHRFAVGEIEAPRLVRQTRALAVAPLAGLVGAYLRAAGRKRGRRRAI
jgi:hypothetical protein